MQSYLEDNEFLGKDSSYAEYFGTSFVSRQKELEEVETNPTAKEFSSVEGFVKEKVYIISLTKEILTAASVCLEKPGFTEEQLQHARHLRDGIIRSV